MDTEPLSASPTSPTPLGPVGRAAIVRGPQPETRAVAAQLRIDDRWSHARSISIRALPGRLRVVDVGTPDMTT